MGTRWDEEAIVVDGPRSDMSAGIDDSGEFELIQNDKEPARHGFVR